MIGALNLFSFDPDHLTPRDGRILQALVDVTTIGLLHQRSPNDDAIAAAQLHSFLSSPAKGALARTQGVSVAAAADLIHDYAHRTHQHPDRVAEAVLANLADPDLIETTESPALLRPAEVAAMFAVSPKTITRWAMTGRLTATRTLGGHRRYRHAEVTRLLNEG